MNVSVTFIYWFIQMYRWKKEYSKILVLQFLFQLTRGEVLLYNILWPLFLSLHFINYQNLRFRFVLGKGCKEFKQLWHKENIHGFITGIFLIWQFTFYKNCKGNIAFCFSNISKFDKKFKGLFQWFFFSYNSNCYSYFHVHLFWLTVTTTVFFFQNCSRSLQL